MDARVECHGGRKRADGRLRHHDAVRGGGMWADTKRRAWARWGGWMEGWKDGRMDGSVAYLDSCAVCLEHGWRTSDCLRRMDRQVTWRRSHGAGLPQGAGSMWSWGT